MLSRCCPLYMVGTVPIVLWSNSRLGIGCLLLLWLSVVLRPLFLGKGPCSPALAFPFHAPLRLLFCGFGFLNCSKNFLVMVYFNRSGLSVTMPST